MMTTRGRLLPWIALTMFVALPWCVRAQTAAGPAPRASAPAPGGARSYFFVRLIPPRPTFATDMTADERTLMGKHVVYWTALFNQGKVLVFGPVQDPKGAFGVAIVEVASREEAQTMIDNDPTVQAGLNRMELAPMTVGLHR